MFKKGLLFFFTAIATLLFIAACHSPVYNQTEANVADQKLKAMHALAKSDFDAKPPSALVMNQGMYVDKTPISLYREPGWLHNHVVLRGDRLPFSYYSRVIASGGGNYILTTYQPGLDPNADVTINYSGTVKGALDLLASKAGFLYTIHGNSVYWQAFVTRTFDVAFTPGSSDYLLGNTSGSGATSAAGGGAGGTVSNYISGDSSNSEFSTFKGTVSVWDDLENTVKQILSKDGTVVVSQSTTTITVRDRPANVDLVGQYIHNLNNNLSRQVLVKVQVLDVTLENDSQFGIDWNLVVNAFHNSPFVVNGNYGTPVSITPFTAQNTNFPANVNGGAVISPLGAGGAPLFGTTTSTAANAKNPNAIPSYTILFNALSQQGKTSVVTEPRAVCLNNQVSVIRITQSANYIASIQTTNFAPSANVTTNSITSQVTPGTVVTGLTLYLLPKIMKDRIYLQVNADLSTVNNFSALTGGIQLPVVSVKHFNQRSMIHSGDTLIMSGFRQVMNTANANQFLTSQALGGKGSQQLSKETIILITPYILGAA